jgi:hypothetical protein
MSTCHDAALPGITRPLAAGALASLVAARTVGNTLRLASLLFVVVCACKGNDSTAYPECGYSAGTCHPSSTSCGIQISCEHRTLGIQCTPPVEKNAQTIECTCVENSVPGKKVRLAFGRPEAPFTGDYQAIVKTACGFD